jgi:hypothetical protein
MRCDAFDTRLNDLLDRRLRPEYDARLAAHARACPRCRETLEIQQTLMADMAGGAMERAPDMARRVVSQIWPVQTRKRSSPRDCRRRWALAVIAASLAMATIPALLGRFSTPTPTAVATVAPPIEVVPNNHSPNPVSPFATSPAPLRSPEEPIAGLARGLGQSMARGMVRVPGVTSAAGPMSLIEPVVLPDELAEHLEPLRPLAGPVAAVVDLLRKSLPRLSDRPDPRSSSVVEPRRSLI